MMKRSALEREGHSIQDEEILMSPLCDVNAWAFGNVEEQGTAVVDLNHQQQEGILPDQEPVVEEQVLEQQNSVASVNVEVEEKAAVSQEKPEDSDDKEEEEVLEEEEEVVLEGAEEVPQEVTLAAPEGQRFQLVIEKPLTDSDVSRYNLSLPGGQLKMDSFLDEKQSRILKRNKSIEVYVRNMGGEKRSTVMKLVKSGGSTENKFTSFLKWKDFVVESQFKENDTIQLWKYEANQQHEFVLRKI